MEKKVMTLEDLLSDDTSVIDKFIKEKIKESRRDIFSKKEETQFVINPDDGYIINDGEFAVILSRIDSVK
jgi:hypothetical protein